MTHASVHRHDHQRRVALQQRVHETRRLLLEAADRLLDLDEAARRGELDLAAASHSQALALVSASNHQLSRLESHLSPDRDLAAAPLRARSEHRDPRILPTARS